MSINERCSTAKSNISRISPLSEKRKHSISHRSNESFQSSISKTHTFLSTYMMICAKYKIRPVTSVKVNSKMNSIEMWGDRMTVDDWQSALEALSTDVSTHNIRIKNKRYIQNLAKEYDTFSNVKTAPKNIPVSGTLYVVREIASAVREILLGSHALVCLQLENVLFDDRALEILISGVSANHELQHLSLAYSRIGDNACVTLCRILRNKPNIRSVDLTGCSLSQTSADAGLVDMIKKQQFKRHEECWAHSLRCRSANPNAMHGLRRLTLNDNTGLGDDGVAEIFESLKDDLYLKAIDLQNCGLTDRGARLALSTLMINDALIVLDVRKNAFISSAMLEAIMVRLYENNTNNPETQLWKWTKLDRDHTDESSSLSIAR